MSKCPGVGIHLEVCSHLSKANSFSDSHPEVPQCVLEIKTTFTFSLSFAQPADTLKTCGVSGKSIKLNISLYHLNILIIHTSLDFFQLICLPFHSFPHFSCDYVCLLWCQVGLSSCHFKFSNTLLPLILWILVSPAIIYVCLCLSEHISHSYFNIPLSNFHIWIRLEYIYIVGIFPVSHLDHFLAWNIILSCI